ncbi:MAG: fluoride efflux transporter FluC [Acidimicrobiales bacterium]
MARARFLSLGAGRAVLIAAGGAAGAGVRWAVQAGFASAQPWPWATLWVNVVGCVVIGAAAARLAGGGANAAVWRDLVSLGFCGGLTTFSSFAVEEAELGGGAALGYLVASVGLGVAGREFGAALGRRR